MEKEFKSENSTGGEKGGGMESGKKKKKQLKEKGKNSCIQGTTRVACVPISAYAESPFQG